MKILGTDTSSKVLSIALSEDRRIIVEESHMLDRRHSSLLVPKIKEMLGRSSISIDDVDAFVIGLGPGSFTGLRIGVSSVKGFGIATKKPCIGIPSIDTMVLNVNRKNTAIKIGTATIFSSKMVAVPILDAKRGNVYSAIYRMNNGRILRKTDYLLLSIDRLMKKIRGPAVFLGDAISLYRERIQRLNGKAVFLEEEYWYPRASSLIELAFGKIKRYKQTDLSKLKPIYLYPKDCQVKRDHNLRSEAK